MKHDCFHFGVLVARSRSGEVLVGRVPCIHCVCSTCLFDRVLATCFVFFWKQDIAICTRTSGKLQDVAWNLKRSVGTLCTHLPRNFFFIFEGILCVFSWQFFVTSYASCI